MADQARKRGRLSAAPAQSDSWEEALADVSNEAAAEFFRNHFNTGLVEKLRYREIDFPPEGRIHVYLHKPYASVKQWCSRFPADIEFWQSRINLPEGVHEGKKVRPNDCLGFRLSTSEQFAAFEKALNDGELQTAKWSNAPTDSAQATTA